MSTADFLFSNGAPSVWTSPSWTNTQSPDWWQAASQALIAKASQVTGQPYQTYSGPRIAELSGNQKNAINNAGAYIPGVNSTFDASKANITAGGELFNEADMNKFMSPYTDNVVNRIAELGGRNLSENLLPAVNDTFIKSGQFGSSRNADFTLRALRDTNESVLGQQAQALESAQKNAMDSYQSALGRQLTSGQSLGALGQITGNENRAQLEELMKMGIIEQGQNQANLDLATKDFENQTNYPLKQLETLNSILRGYGANLGTTSTSYSAANPAAVGAASSASPLSNISNLLAQWGQRPTQ